MVKRWGQRSEKTLVEHWTRELIHHHVFSIVSLPTELQCFSGSKRVLSYIIIVNLRPEEWIRNPPSYYCSEPITLLIGLYYIVKNRLNYFLIYLANYKWMVPGHLKYLLPHTNSLWWKESWWFQGCGLASSPSLRSLRWVTIFSSVTESCRCPCLGNSGGRNYSQPHVGALLGFSSPASHIIKQIVSSVLITVLLWLLVM